MPNRKARSWLYGLLPIIAIVAALYYSEQKGFPYAGVWKGKLQRVSDRKAEAWFVKFSEDRCAVGGEYRGQEIVFPCAYRMRYGVAVVKFTMPNVKINGQMVDCMVTAFVHPQDQGKTLRLETRSVEYSRDVGESEPTGRDTVILRKVS